MEANCPQLTFWLTCKENRYCEPDLFSNKSFLKPWSPTKLLFSLANKMYKGHFKSWEARKRGGERHVKSCHFHLKEHFNVFFLEFVCMCVSFVSRVLFKFVYYIHLSRFLVLSLPNLENTRLLKGIHNFITQDSHCLLFQSVCA